MQARAMRLMKVPGREIWIFAAASRRRRTRCIDEIPGDEGGEGLPSLCSFDRFHSAGGTGSSQRAEGSPGATRRTFHYYRCSHLSRC